MIAKPPFAGADQETTAEVLPGTAETPLGAPGTVAGVTEAEAEEAVEGPTAFLATTVNVRAVPLVRLLKLALRTFPTFMATPMEGVTVYSVIAEPPFEAGAVQDTVADALLATAETAVGAPGTVTGVTEAEGEEAVEGPTAFVARTLNVTEVPLVSPDMLAVNTFPTVRDIPVEEVTVYPVIAEPPSDAGAVQETVADALSGTADTPVGASGTVAGIITGDCAEGKESPAAFIAITVNLTAIPLVRLLSVAVRTFPTVRDTPVETVTLYPVIAEPPFIAGAVQETIAEELPGTAETLVGAPGTAIGVTEAEAEEAVEGPTEFLATTVNVRAVPLVRLLKLAVRTFPTVTAVPVDGVTVYSVITEPPFEAGAVQLTVADALPATAETPVGAPGTVTGVTEAEAEEGVEGPTEFLATTVNVTAVPLVRLLSVAVNTLPTVSGLPTEGVTVYPVIAAPFEAGAVHETVAEAFAATAETPVGASGTVAGVTAVEAEEGKESPREFIAITVNVVAVPLVRLLTLAVRTFPTVTAVPVEGITLYPVIAEPPFEAGAVQLTVAELLLATAETPVGAPATVDGVTSDEAKEGKELPAEFLATTVNVREVPLVSPVKLALRTFPTVTGLPTDGVTVYSVIAEPPEAGAVQETVAEALPATAETPVGTPGTDAGVTAAEAEEGSEFPTEFVAKTVNVTGVPFVRLLSVAVRTFPTVTATPVDAVTV